MNDFIRKMYIERWKYLLASIVVIITGLIIYLFLFSLSLKEEDVSKGKGKEKKRSQGEEKKKDNKHKMERNYVNRKTSKNVIKKSGKTEIIINCIDKRTKKYIRMVKGRVFCYVEGNLDYSMGIKISRRPKIIEVEDHYFDDPYDPESIQFYIYLTKPIDLSKKKKNIKTLELPDLNQMSRREYEKVLVGWAEENNDIFKKVKIKRGQQIVLNIPMEEPVPSNERFKDYKPIKKYSRWQIKEAKKYSKYSTNQRINEGEKMVIGKLVFVKEGKEIPLKEWGIRVRIKYFVPEYMSLEVDDIFELSYGKEDYTDKNGNFRFDRIYIGQYRICELISPRNRADSLHSLLHNKFIEVKPGKKVQHVKVKLFAEDFGSLKFQVIDKNTKKAIHNKFKWKKWKRRKWKWIRAYCKLDTSKNDAKYKKDWKGEENFYFKLYGTLIKDGKFKIDRIPKGKYNLEILGGDKKGNVFNHKIKDIDIDGDVDLGKVYVTPKPRKPLPKGLVMLNLVLSPSIKGSLLKDLKEELGVCGAYINIRVAKNSDSKWYSKNMRGKLIDRARERSFGYKSKELFHDSKQNKKVSYNTCVLGYLYPGRFKITFHFEKYYYPGKELYVTIDYDPHKYQRWDKEYCKDLGTITLYKNEKK